MRFRTSISRVSSLFFSDDQVYECIVQTASTGFEQIAQKLNDLHMETVRDIVIVGRCLGCGVTVLFIIKLFGEELGLLKGLKACQSCRCWSFAAPLPLQAVGSTPRWMHSTTYSFIHHVDVVPRCSINNTVKTVLAVKQVDEMEISPTARLAYLSSADQRLEQDLPDYVDLTPDVDKHYLTLRNLGWSCAS